MEVKKRVQNGHFGSHFDPLSGGVHRGFPVVFLGYLAPKGVPKWGNMGGQGVSQNGGPFWTPIWTPRPSKPPVWPPVGSKQGVPGGTPKMGLKRVYRGSGTPPRGSREGSPDPLGVQKGVHFGPHFGPPIWRVALVIRWGFGGLGGPKRGPKWTPFWTPFGTQESRNRPFLDPFLDPLLAREPTGFFGVLS